MINKDKIFYALLGVSAATIPMPGIALSSILVILLVFWWLFFTNSIQEKISELKKSSKEVILLNIPFALTLLGLIYTDDLSGALSKTQLLLPFLVFPLIFFSFRLSKSTIRFVFYCFSLGTLLSALIGVLRASYFRWNNLGDYFYYHNFSVLVDKHTTYFSLFVVLSFLFIFREVLKSRIKYFYGSLILIFFILVLYITSVRISIIALMLGMIFIVFKEVQSKFKWLILLFPFILLSFYFSPNFQKRFDLSDTEKGELHDFQFRKEHWQSVMETIHNNSILFGNGSGSSRDFLYETYRKYHLTSAYELEYNAHNQFLEFILDFGLIGFFAFLIMLIYLSVHFFKFSNSLAFTVFLVFCIYFMTESLLQRHDGVTIFSLLMSLFLMNKKLKA